MSIRLTVCSLALGFLCSTPVLAQGRSSQAPGKNKGTTTGAPSRNQLAAVAVVPTGGVNSATPLAWVDDASLLSPGALTVSTSVMRWSGAGISEVDAPIIDVAAGLTPRLQISASVPHVVGSADPNGAAGGVGTSFFGAKIGVYEHAKSSVKVAATPTLQVLGEGVVATLGPDDGRVRWGLPVSAEISRGTLRVYGGSGYFSPGLWFAGAALSKQATSKVFVSGGFSRAWRHSDIADVPLSERDHKELSGGVAYVLHPTITVFGSIGRTVMTLAENGAGTSIVGGASFSFAASTARP
jgi:hypothetical protein